MFNFNRLLFRRLLPVLALSSAAFRGVVGAMSVDVSPGPAWDAPGCGFRGTRVGPDFSLLGIFFVGPSLMPLVLPAPRPGSSGLGIDWKLRLWACLDVHVSG